MHPLCNVERFASSRNVKERHALDQGVMSEQNRLKSKFIYNWSDTLRAIGRELSKRILALPQTLTPWTN